MYLGIKCDVSWRTIQIFTETVEIKNSECPRSSARKVCGWLCKMERHAESGKPMAALGCRSHLTRHWRIAEQSGNLLEMRIQTVYTTPMLNGQGGDHEVGKRQGEPFSEEPA